jgi:outer membrane protein OmpA-like peptidoglycan-associated protein
MLAFIACSNQPVVQDYAETASPTGELASLVSDIKSATDKQVNILSPDNYQESVHYNEEAESQLRNQKKSKDILHSIAKSRAYLKQANDFAKISKENMNEIIKVRNQAIEAKAHNYFQSDFKELDKNLMNATSMIEDNDIKDAIEEKGSLQLDYLAIELRAIKYATLEATKQKIEKAVDEGAEKFAPRSLAIAQQNLADADAYITANRHNANGIKTQSMKAEKSADHLTRITSASITGSRTTDEETALQADSQTNVISARDQQLLNARGTNQQNSTQIMALKAQNEDLAGANELNEQYESARKQFTKDEAEVYKRGQTLVIRLRGLKFPVSRSTLTGENFPLLAKVQKVIQEFDSGSVMVQGHTDSDGGKEINQKISTERAEAVKEYLMSNSSNQDISIESMGYDFQKPLASNKTPVGRAQNRRVDVLITPAGSNVSL